MAKGNKVLLLFGVAALGLILFGKKKPAATAPKLTSAEDLARYHASIINRVKAGGNTSTSTSQTAV